MQKRKLRQTSVQNYVNSENADTLSYDNKKEQNTTLCGSDAKFHGRTFWQGVVPLFFNLRYVWYIPYTR